MIKTTFDTHKHNYRQAPLLAARPRAHISVNPVGADGRIWRCRCPSFTRFHQTERIAFLSNFTVAHGHCLHKPKEKKSNCRFSSARQQLTRHTNSDTVTAGNRVIVHAARAARVVCTGTFLHNLVVASCIVCQRRHTRRKE